MTSDLGLAFLFASLSVILLSLGLGTQKYALTPSFFQRTSSRNKRKTTRSSVWVMGLIMTGGSVILSFFAVSLGSISLVASVGGVGLVALALFSYSALKEEVDRTMLIGMMFIGVGTTLFGLLIKESTTTIIDESGLLTFVVVLVIASISVLLSAARGYWLGGVIFGFVSGLLAGIGLTLQKCSTMETSVGLQLLASKFFYGWAVATGLSFVVTQFALKKGTAVSVVPSYNSTALILPQIAGIVVLAESLELLQWFAISILVFGIVLLAGHRKELPKIVKTKAARALHSTSSNA